MEIPELGFDSCQHTYPKNTGAWKGRLKRFFVDPETLELAKNGTNIN